MKTLFLTLAAFLLFASNAMCQTTTDSVPTYMQSYLKIKDALFTDNAENARAAATEMKTKMSEAKIADEKITAEINEALTAIESAASIADQRKSFSALSQSLIDLLKKNPIAIPLYIDYCGMAINSNGS